MFPFLQQYPLVVMTFVLLCNPSLKGWTVNENRIAVRLWGWDTNDTHKKKKKTDNGRDRFREKKGEWETKERVAEQWEVYAVCQHKKSEMSVFVLHQWVMAAIIPPNGYKQAILAHCFHTKMKQAEFSTVGIPRASRENGVWKHASHKDWWGEI